MCHINWDYSTIVKENHEHTHHPDSIERGSDAGQLRVLPGANLWFLNRTSNLYQAWDPLFSAFDPYHRLAQAQAESGWVIDYCHCPSIPHASKDVYIDEHRSRLEAVLTNGDGSPLAAGFMMNLWVQLRRENVLLELPVLAGDHLFHKLAGNIHGRIDQQLPLFGIGIQRLFVFLVLHGRLAHIFREYS